MSGAGEVPALLPCPFCGGAVRMRRRSGNVGRVCPSRYYREHVHCETCGAMGPEGKAPNVTVARWNKLAGLAARPVDTGREKALEEALQTIATGAVPRERAFSWRADCQPSKHDRCEHSVPMYEDCGECIAAFAARALANPENGRG